MTIRRTERLVHPAGRRVSPCLIAHTPQTKVRFPTDVSLSVLFESACPCRILPTLEVWFSADGALSRVRLSEVLVALRTQQGLDCASLVHRAIALCNLLEWKGQVEDLAGIDRALHDQVNQMWQVSPYRRGTAM